MSNCYAILLILGQQCVTNLIVVQLISPRGKRYPTAPTNLVSWNTEWCHFVFSVSPIAFITYVVQRRLDCRCLHDRLDTDWREVDKLVRLDLSVWLPLNEILENKQVFSLLRAGKSSRVWKLTTLRSQIQWLAERRTLLSHWRCSRWYH